MKTTYVNVSVNGAVEATIETGPRFARLPDVKAQYTGISSATITPAGRKVFGGPRCRVYGLTFHSGKWWTL